MGEVNRTSAAVRRAWIRRAWWLTPLAILLGLTLPHLADGDWMRGDSAWYAAIGVQAWRTGNLWTLFEAPGTPYFNKPPLGFWMQGAWMSLAGVGPWQARAWTILAAGIGVLSVGAIARRLAGRQAALLCALLVAINVEYFRRTREISLDMWNTAFMFLGAWAMVGLASSRSRGALRVILAGLAIGAALMTKPLVGLAAPALIGGWLVWSARRKNLPQAPGPQPSPLQQLVRAGSVLILAVAVAAPWHVSMALIHGEAFTSQYFGREIADRAAGDLVGGQRQTQPAWFYLANLASAWTLWLVAALVLIARRPARVRWNTPLTAMGAIWVLGWLLLLTLFPDRRDRYAIPVHAGMALVLGGLLAARVRALSVTLRWAPIVIAIAASIFALLPVRVQRGVAPQWPSLFDWMKASGITQVWDGSFAGAPAARLYLQTGAWPHPTRDRTGAITAPPPPGATILYHRRGGFAPGPGETILWHRDDLTATRLDGPRWNPLPAPDPGE